MGEDSKFIASERRNIPTPTDLVENGLAHFGTFESEFDKLSLLSCRHPTHSLLPNRLKLTLWEAVEINLKDAFLVSAVSDMGFFGMCFNVLWDKKENKEYHWVERVKSSKNESKKHVHIAENLKNGRLTYCEEETNKIRFENNFEKGEARYTLFARNKAFGYIRGNFALSKIAAPSIVSIPFGKNRPLYSEKMFFKAEGKLELNGRVYESDGASVAVIDDHRGYYPRKMHYDWLSFMGKDNEGELSGFNLTDNQSTDPFRYNENLLWLAKGNSLLPPIHFRKSAPTLSFVDPVTTPIVWEIMDEHDRVHLTYTLQAVFKDHERHALGLIKIDYFVVYGYLSGYVRDEKGNQKNYEGLEAIGEDKSLLF
jgi:hypothetical protein